MATASGIDVIQHAGQVYIVDTNGNPLIGLSPEAAEMFVLRMANAILEARGKEPIAFQVLAEILTGPRS